MARPLSDEQRSLRATYVRAALSNGTEWKDIAAMLGMKTESLRDWWLRGGKDAQPTASVVSPQTRVERALAKAGVTMRDCLTCRDPFPSFGSGNRRCQRCVQNTASMSPYAPDPGGSAGRRMAPAKGHQ
jgi:hypothetical protein